MNRWFDRILLGLIAALAVILVYVVSGTLEPRIVNAGDIAPNFTITTDQGRPISRDNFGGKLLVLNFWASWCEPCIEETPSLNMFQREFAKQGVVVLGISIDRNEKLYRQFLNNRHVAFPTARDPDANISGSYGTFQIPETYLIDRSGKVVEKVISNQNWMDPDFLFASPEIVVIVGLRERVDKILGPRGYLHHPEDLSLYEYDGGLDKSRPDLVVFPQSTEDVVALVKLASELGVVIVGRGAGTGLSGGAIARAGGIIISFARMNRILEIDLPNERAVVQPGVVNLDLTAAVEADGYFYAPDPSSQRACTIGGNVSENSGGPHTLAYGVTTNHVLGIEAVLPDGTVIETGGKTSDLPGYDLTGLLVGSEGTMVLVTKVTVRLMRKPEVVKTILAIYDRTEDAGDTVTEITARAITPVAIEMLDGVLLRMIEEATHAGYPMDAAAVLLIELEGMKEAVEEQTEQVRGACLECHAREFREARTPEERELLWKGRKNAFGAVGRFSPASYVQDGVVPRTQIAPTLRFIQDLAQRHGLTISNIFHAGDGNLHPLIMFDPRKPGELEKVKRASDEILDFCISVGGSITGEHGVGMEKMEMMGHQFSDDTLEMIGRFKKLFDPSCRLNPGKVLPTGRGCMEIRQRPGDLSL